MAARGTLRCHVAEGEDPAPVFEPHPDVAVSAEPPRGIDRRAPGEALVAREHHETASLVCVLPHQAAEFIAVGRTKDERLAGIFILHFGNEDRIGPGETSVGGDGLEDPERGFIRSLRPLVIESEITTVLQLHDAAEGHDAGKAERRHLAPGRTLVLAHDRGHPRAAAFAESGRPDPDPGFSRRIDESVNAGTVLVRRVAGRQGLVEPRPGETAVTAFRHGSGGPAVIDAPDGEDRFLIGHQQGRGMSLVGLLRARRDDDVAVFFLRQIDEGQIGSVGGEGQSRDRGEESGGDPFHARSIAGMGAAASTRSRLKRLPTKEGQVGESTLSGRRLPVTGYRSPGRRPRFQNETGFRFLGKVSRSIASPIRVVARAQNRYRSNRSMPQICGDWIQTKKTS